MHKDRRIQKHFVYILEYEETTKKTKGGRTMKTSSLKNY